MNVLNLSVNVNIALASYVIKQFKCRGRPLSDPLKLDQNYITSDDLDLCQAITF